MRDGLRELRRDAALRRDVAAAGLEIGLLVAVEVQELREPPGDRARVEHLVRDAGSLGHRDRAGHEIRLAMVQGLTLAGRQDQRAAGREQSLAGRRLELPPDAMGGEDEGHVIGAFADGLAGDPGLAVARPEGVGRREAIEADDLRAAPSELVQDGASHGAETNHSDIDSLTHACFPFLSRFCRGGVMAEDRRFVAR